MKTTLAIVFAILLDLAAMLIKIKMDWLDVDAATIHLSCTVLLAVIFYRTGLVQPAAMKLKHVLSFRTIVVTISLLLGSIFFNTGSSLLQEKIFGKLPRMGATLQFYQENYGLNDFTENLNEADKVVLTQAKRVIHEFINVSQEELIFRWIVLGGLVLILPSGWALALSSVIFAGFHLAYPIYLGSPVHGYSRLLPTLAIGLFTGIAFIRYGLASAIFIHFIGNLVRLFAYDPHLDFLVDWILWGSVFVSVVVLPLTLWFTRKREATG